MPIIVLLDGIMVFEAVLWFIWDQPTWAMCHGRGITVGRCWNK